MSDRRRTDTSPQDAPVSYKDVDEIIRRATELMQADQSLETLTPEELQRIGDELDIPARYIDEARALRIERLQQEARSRRAMEVTRQARRQRHLLRARWGMALFAGAVALSGLVMSAIHNDLGTRALEVARQRAQVHNVLVRRDEVRARFATVTASPERDAELSGADNRVFVEQRRYDQLVADYNAAAASIPNRWVVERTQLPRSLPLSTELKSW
ncbi:LemA family protein [Myxococcus sp. K38C18041901]|uniref:LemA family protein n=1 Tax=Myxococcus guangdongensis TaxID=2906760 RepID=UPI0020A7CFBD|nr:LemA family protein [Myxococcus guangdongensis]MCP3065144.1 LemA family protein [Myxococcus guangdongensis]